MYIHVKYNIFQLESKLVGITVTNVKQKQDFSTGLDIKDMLQSCLAIMYG